MATELRAKLVIDAQTSGDKNIAAIAVELEKLAQAGGDASPKLGQLSQELNKLGAQQSAIRDFERLKKATEEAAARAQQLQQATRNAALALKEKQTALMAATAAQTQANAALDQARAQQSAMGEAIKQLGGELKSMAKAAKESGDTSAVMAEQLKDGQAQLSVLKTQYKDTAAGVAALAQAQRDSASAARGAQRDVAGAQKEFEGLRQSAGQAKQALASQNQELQRARDALSGLGLSSKALSAAQLQTTQGVQGASAAIAALAAKAQEAAAVLANRDLLGVRAHAEVQKEIEKTRAAYEQLKASGKLSGAELAQAAMKADERVRELSQSTNGWKESLGKARTELVALAASGAGFAVAAKKAMDFETAMANVAKTANGSQAQMAQLAGEIKAMTDQIPIAATELAAMAAAGGQLGIPVERLKEFVLLSAQMSTAFGMSAEQTGQAVAKLANIFSLPLGEVRKLGDAINVLGNTTAAKEADIVEVLTRIGGTAKQFGLSAQQAAALATAMLSLGTSAEVAGTGINAILAKLQTANIQGNDFKLALAGMGVSAQQLAKDIRDNPQKALSDFLATLSKLEGGRQAEVLAQLFGIEYQDDVARLLAGLQGYEKALGSVGDAAQVAGSMQKEFETRVQTTQAQLTLLKNAVDGVGINLGSVLLPAIRGTADVLRDGAQAMATFAEKHPALAVTATTLLAAGANLTALSLGLKAMQVAASTAFPALTTGALGAGTAVGGLLTVLRTALGPIAAVWAAFEAGQYVGEKLSSKFVEVERAGIALAAGLTRAAAMAQTAWEMMKAPFTDDTVAAAQERLRVKLEQIDNEYAELFANAGKAKEAVQAQGQAADAAAQANTRVSAAVQAVTDAMRAQGGAAQGAAQAAQAAATELEQVFAQSVKGAQSLETLTQLRDKLKEAAANGRLSAEAVAGLRAQIDQAGATKGVDALLGQFRKLNADVAGVQLALENMVASLKFDDKASIATFARALQALGSQGVLSAQQVDAAWQQALTKLDARQLSDFALQAKAAFAQGAMGAQAFAQVNEQVLARSFEGLGVNAAQALGKISPAAQAAQLSVQQVAESAKAAGVGAKDAARAIEMAFAAAVPKADSLQAIEAMQQQLKALGASGQLGADGVARLQQALDKQRLAIEQQIPGIQSLGEALKELGVKPQAELAALAAKAKEAFEVVRTSGTATPREINEAWRAMAQAAIEANNGVADAALASEAAAHGFAIETDKAGKSAIKSLSEVEGAARGVGEAAQEAGEQAKDGLGKIDYAAQMAGKSLDELEKITRRNWDAQRSLADQAAESNAAANEAVNAWLKQQTQQSKYYGELFASNTKATGATKDLASALGAAQSAASRLSNTRGAPTMEHVRATQLQAQALQALDEAQQGAARSSGEAQNGLAQLEDRLLALNAGEEALAQARARRDQDAVRAKMALLQLDLERARIRQNQTEVQAIEKEMAAYARQIDLIGQIAAREAQLREEKKKKDEQEQRRQEQERKQAQARQEQERKEQERKERERQDAAKQEPRQEPRQELPRAQPQEQPQAQASGGGIWGGGSAPVVNITLNANGVEDPARLARLIEPELRRMATLSR